MNSASQSALADTAPVKQHATLDIEPPKTITREQVQDLFLHELSHEERLLAILWYVERMTPDEIALALDTTTAQIRIDHSRILQKLG